MNIDIKIKKGLDLHLVGAADNAKALALPAPAVAAVVPDDFPGLTLKPAVHEGDEVAVGSPLLRDKSHPDVVVVSPLKGKVKAIVRGERRKILRVEVEADSAVTATAPTIDRADPRKALQTSGLWALMRQRPYDTVVSPDARVRDIYVTGFDSAPLAVNITDFPADVKARMSAAVKLLGALTQGKVYISRRPDQQMPDIDGATMLTVSGPHPAGLASTLISATAPVNKEETVATLDLATLLRIGHLVEEGRFDPSALVAVVGSEVEKPHLAATIMGAPVADLLRGVLAKSEHLRIISGNVLTGKKVDADGFLRFPYRQITVIPEGDDADEFMGWASLSPNKMSVSPSFPAAFLRRKLFRPDARTLGGKRAMIQSGQFDAVMPLDILPEFLLKAIIARDIERMEALGIYEVAPEDFALAEYVDISKMELQQIVAEGLDFLRKELE